MKSAFPSLDIQILVFLSSSFFLLSDIALEADRRYMLNFMTSSVILTRT